MCAWMAGDANGASREYRRALAAAERTRDDAIIGIALGNLAGQLNRQGQYAEAVELNQLAVERLTRARDHKSARWAAYNRATQLGHLGRLSEERQALEVVHAQIVEAGAHDELGGISVALGNLHLLLDDLEGAQRRFLEVAPDDKRQRPYADLGLGRIAVRTGDLDEAASRLDRAIEAAPSAWFALYPRTFRAQVELLRGRPAEARDLLVAIVRDADAIQQSEMSWFARSLLANAFLADAGTGDQAIAMFREAVASIEAHGEKLDPAAVGLRYLRARVQP
jgi:tetratricopeptide (TPR) repeat protein